MKQSGLIILMLWTGSLFGQPQTETFSPNYIKSIILKGNSEFTGNPIINLGQNLTLQFDDIIIDL